MANGTTRLALARMRVNGNQPGPKEMVNEIDILSSELTGSQPKKMRKISLKNPSEHNHSK